MNIDRPGAGDIAPLRRLWKQAFADTDAFLAGFFAEGFSQDCCRCLWTDGYLAAALYWFDCEWSEKKLAYLYAVATEEAFRGQGLCRALMEDTHAHLARLGYAGAVLVPASNEVWGLYEKLGYRGFCPMEKQLVLAGTPGQITPVDAKGYAALRRERLPENAVMQEGKTLAFLETYAGFYVGEDCLFCAAREGDEVYFQEFFGSVGVLPGMVAAMGASKGYVRLPGGSKAFAMYRSFTEDRTLPGYLGIALD